MSAITRHEFDASGGEQMTDLAAALGYAMSHPTQLPEGGVEFVLAAIGVHEGQSGKDIAAPLTQRPTDPESYYV